jgi:hypothetical protein
VKYKAIISHAGSCYCYSEEAETTENAEVEHLADESAIERKKGGKTISLYKGSLQSTLGQA